MTRKTVSILTAVVVVLIGVALPLVPGQGLLGMTKDELGAFEVAIAAGLATVLLWYGLFYEPR